jgi:hypothetical protein
MSRPPRPTWPETEWQQWNESLSSEQDPELNAVECFENRIREILLHEIRNFVSERCQERGVGSPDLRRLAPVALWQSIEGVTDKVLVEAAAACREVRLPWAALSFVTDYAGPSGFQRRYASRVSAAIESRAQDRSSGCVVYGDPDYQ